ncbi:nucleoside deaminase [Bradyrhizobium sp.]|uniref:nucleoside deaminase n=1 Tax=Bradyrhizobium sp. TaxID=376 RepID=UPI003C760315
MDKTPDEQHDRMMMARAIALSKQSGASGEYPYGVLICRGGKVVAESINRVKHDRDVTRHAEVVAISAAQKALRCTSLDDCVIYGSAEPCVLCSYAIRESRIGRVVYGLHSPHMGGLSKWNVLKDESLSRTMPEVFAPPPTIVAGFMADEADRALLECNPLVWMAMKRRGLFVTEAPGTQMSREPSLPRNGHGELLWGPLRRNFFDRFGRR